MLVPLLTIRIKCLPTFLLPYQILKWFITIVGGWFHSHLTTYLFVIPNFFLSFHQTLWFGRSSWLLYSFHAFTLELLEAVRLGGYTLPALSRLSISLLQEQALQILREHTIITFKLFTETSRRIRWMMALFNNGRGSSQNYLVDFHHSSSNAEKNIQRVNSHHSISNDEQTIQSYFTSDTLPTSRPLVTTPNGINYPTNHCNGYVSKWPDNFSGCLAFGSTNNRFTTCTKKDNIDN